MTKQFLSTRYTRTAIDIIREKVTRLANILNITVQIIFMVYYSFMIFSNRNSVLHIILYSVFLGISIFVFILGFLFKNHDDDTQKVLKLRKEKKKKILNITHIVKYVARSVILIFSLYEVLSSSNSTDMQVFLTIISGIFFICQILFEIVVKLINTYVDYIRLSVEKDIESSNLISIVKFFTNKNGNTVPFYTEKEENILNFLEIETEMRYPSKKPNQKSTNEPMIEEKTKGIESVVGKGLFSFGKRIVNNLTKMSTKNDNKEKTITQNSNEKNVVKSGDQTSIEQNFTEDNNYQETSSDKPLYTNKNLEIKKDKVNKYSSVDLEKANKKQSATNKNIVSMYESKIVEASKIVEDFESVVNVLYSANEKYLRISNTQNELSLIPDFIAITLSYIRKDYNNINSESMNKILGTLLYFVAPNDVIPDAIPFIGYNDDIIVIRLCLQDTKNDFINYYEWKNQIEVESLTS